MNRKFDGNSWRRHFRGEKLVMIKLGSSGGAVWGAEAMKLKIKCVWAVTSNQLDDRKQQMGWRITRKYTKQSLVELYMKYDEKNVGAEDLLTLRPKKVMNPHAFSANDLYKRYA